MILYYDCLAEFNRQYYKDLLLPAHLISGQIKIGNLHYPDGQVDEEANFWGYKLEKDNVKYLLPCLDDNNNEIDIKTILPIVVTRTMKVASKNDVYLQIMDYDVASFKKEQTMTFKELFDKLSSHKHSHSKHQKLFWFIGITSMFDRVNFRVSTPAGFGKDSVVDILGNLIGGCCTIEHPTIAKLEYMTSKKWLAINEIVDLSSGDWRNIEQFLLATGAHKPVVTKHSRAYGGTEEMLDISDFSISVMYNDIDHYPRVDKYFDFVSKKAVHDRLPAFRLYGKLEEDFNSASNLNVANFVKQNMLEYKELIYNLLFYKENNHSNYITTKLMNIPHRWMINIHRLLKVIGLYCDNQEEFDSWIDVINNCLLDYQAMVTYPSLLERLTEKVDSKHYSIYFQEIKKIVTFTDKIEYINRILNGKPAQAGNTTVDKFWS